MPMLWTVPAAILLAAGSYSTPQMVEEARLYEQEKEPVIEVLEIQASEIRIDDSVELSDLGW
jgi:hypothetical protein